MFFQSQLLSEAEKEQVHHESLRILAQAGVRFYSEKALQLLTRNDARVDFETKTAYLSAELCDQALQTCPKAFILGARNPDFDYPLPSPPSPRILKPAKGVMVGTRTTNLHSASSNTWIWVSCPGRQSLPKTSPPIQDRCMNGSVC